MPDAPQKAKITIAEAREKLIAYLTDQWLNQLTALAATLQAQGFSDVETLDLCESYRPMFEENLTKAVAEFDREAGLFHLRTEIADAIKRRESNA